MPQGVFNRVNAFVVTLVYAYSIIYLLRKLIAIWGRDGDDFQHADWLISFSSGIVRRGFSGEIFLTLSEATGIHPVTLVSLAHALLIVLIILALWRIGQRLGMTDLTTLLLLSPLLVLLWVNDIGNAYRKEMLGILAFLPIVLAPGARLSHVVSYGFYIFAVALHEANIFFGPALIYAHSLTADRTLVPVSTVVLGVVTLAGAAFGLIFTSLPDTTAMCQRILDAGGSESLCQGIIPWLASGFSRTGSEVLSILAYHNVPLAVLNGLACLALLFLVASRILKERIEWIAVAIVFLTFLPLFFLATDWSRWLSMQAFAISFILLIKLAKAPDTARPLPVFVFLPALAFCLVVGVKRSIPEPVEGLAFKIAELVGKATRVVF